MEKIYFLNFSKTSKIDLTVESQVNLLAWGWLNLEYFSLVLGLLMSINFWQRSLVSVGSINNPESPTTSLNGGILETITGVLIFIDSMAGIPKPSYVLGKTEAIVFWYRVHF